MSKKVGHLNQAVRKPDPGSVKSMSVDQLFENLRGFIAERATDDGDGRASLAHANLDALRARLRLEHAAVEKVAGEDWRRNLWCE